MKKRTKLNFSVSRLKDNLVTAFEPLQRLNTLNHCSLPDIPNVHLEDHKYISLVSELVKLEHANFHILFCLFSFKLPSCETREESQLDGREHTHLPEEKTHFAVGNGNAGHQKD